MVDRSFVIDPDLIAQEIWADKDIIVPHGLFGGINSSRDEIESHGFVDTFDLLRLGHISWPGGTLSETAVVRENGNIQLPTNPDLPYAYDLSYPELFHPRALVDADGNRNLMMNFTDMIRMALENDVSLAVISPTLRHRDNPAEGGRILKAFLEDLYVNGRWNDGIVPRDFVIELGNENYDCYCYSRHVVAQLRALREFRQEHPEFDVRIGVQTAQQPDVNTELIQLIAEQSPGEYLLAEADMVRTHDLMHGLQNVRDFEHSGKADMMRELMLAIEADRAALGITDAPEIEVYVSAWSTSPRDVDPELSSDLPSAQAALSFLTGALELGADLGAAWGIGMPGPDVNQAVLFWHDRESDSSGLTPKGLLFEQMAEILPGMKLVQHGGMDAGRSWPANIQVFSDDAKVVMFLAANDLPSDDFVVEVQLPGVGELSNVWAESIQVESGISGTPVVTNPEMTVGDERVSVVMTRDYEIIRIVANRADASTDPVWMLAAPGGERLQGALGDDRLVGMNGPDTLLGAGGDDFLFGGSGTADLRDLIFGDEGNDYIDGGWGNDEVHGGEGHDTILGNFGSDTLIGNQGDDLISGGAGSDLIFGGFGDDTLNGGWGHDRMNGGVGADRFYHAGVRDHASDWIQDYNAAEGDVLVFGLAGATRAQFQVNTNFTPGAGSGDVEEAFIIYRPTGQIMWALVDGDAQSSINLLVGGQVYDLLA